MTCKMIIISSRKEGMTHERFIEYLEQEHMPLVKELSHLKRVTTSIPCTPERIGSPLDQHGARYDVMAELQFENLENLKTAFDSKEGRRVLQDAQNFANIDESIMIAIVDESLQYQALPSVI